ncbi:MAG: FAD-dependent oxidoreductase, partial [Spirochaetota bacterium]
MQPEKDVIIIGAGAAGLSAAQYAARANLKTLLIEEMAAGGQALVIDSLENYPGFPEKINGADFSQRMERQARNFGVEILNATVTRVENADKFFNITTNNGEFTCYAVILCTGAKHSHIGIPGEKEFTG